MLGCLATIGGGILAAFLILALLFFGVNSTVTQEMVLPPAIEVQPTYEMPAQVATATIVRPTQAPTATLIEPTRVPTQDFPTAFPTATVAASTFVSHYAGIEQSFTSEGFPRLGNPDAPIVIEYFSSFACSHCKTLYEAQLLLNLDFVRSGDVLFIFHPITFISNTGLPATEMAHIALCAGVQGNFWDMHDVMFSAQDSGFMPTGAELNEILLSLGLNVDKFNDCYSNSLQADVIAASEEMFSDLGFNSTPSVMLNGEVLESGYNGITDAIEAELGE